MTALGVVAVVVVLATAVLNNGASVGPLRWPVWLLLALVVLQLLLGVEAWMFKFSAGGLPPEARPVTVAQAAVRTAHVLAGSWVLAAAVAAALQAGQLTAIRAEIGEATA
jgi:hypothetical protein